MQFNLRSVVACVVLGSAGYLAACSSDDGGGGSGGKGGSSSGGKGGSASGGKGGSSTGGKGGSSSGGNAGSGSGGSASGGSAAGGAPGTGGVAAGGMAGTPAGTGGTPPGTSGPGVFFSGKDMTVTKLVAADAMPGYFYASANVPKGPVIEPVMDAALPEGTKFAVTFDLDPAVGGNLIIGWNWRQDMPAMKWQFFDASAFAGVSFWVKAETTSPALGFTGYFQYDDTNFTAATPQGGNCAAEPCPPISEYAAVIARKSGWTRIVQRFAYQTSGTPNLKGLARVDLLQLRLAAGGNPAKLLLTGLQLLKEADLPPAM